MTPASKLSNEEYETLSLEYERKPPALSGEPGFFTNMREQMLVTELLSPDYARIIKAKAKAMSQTPSEVIQNAIKMQFINNS